LPANFGEAAKLASIKTISDDRSLLSVLKKLVIKVYLKANKLLVKKVLEKLFNIKVNKERK
jgi:ribosomal protein L23